MLSSTYRASGMMSLFHISYKIMYTLSQHIEINTKNALTVWNVRHSSVCIIPDVLDSKPWLLHILPSLVLHIDAVTPFLTHWRYYRLALSHRHMRWSTCSLQIKYHFSIGVRTAFDFLSIQPVMAFNTVQCLHVLTAPMNMSFDGAAEIRYENTKWILNAFPWFCKWVFLFTTTGM